MAQPTPGTYYVVQQGDTLSSIAQSAYGDPNVWPEIYTDNAQVIGNNPHAISIGTQLYLINNPQQIQVYLTTQLCKVTVNSLNVRARPTSESSVVASYREGTPLNFTQMVQGESVQDNDNWGQSAQGHYFWLGGTDRPNG